MLRHVAAALVAILIPACSVNDLASGMLGMPGPSEWQRRRAEFVRRLPESRILVFPPAIDGSRWMSPALLVEHVAKVSKAAVAAPGPANLPPPEEDLFSYRYLPARLRQYSAWTREANLDADYLLFMEIYTGRVPGTQIIVIDRSGVAADIRRIHWGAAPPADDRGVVTIIERCYLDALFTKVQKPCPGRGLS